MSKMKFPGQQPAVEMLGEYVLIRDAQSRTVAFLQALHITGIIQGVQPSLRPSAEHVYGCCPCPADDSPGHCTVVIDNQLIELPVPAQAVAEAVDEARRKGDMGL